MKCIFHIKNIICFDKFFKITINYRSVAKCNKGLKGLSYEIDFENVDEN